MIPFDGAAMLANAAFRPTQWSGLQRQSDYRRTARKGYRRDGHQPITVSLDRSSLSACRRPVRQQSSAGCAG
jgi:hypothetical protein